MPQVQYPFIDIAVHPAVRARFAAGEAIALFSRDMAQVLWANGEGAKLFGYSDIYDFFDNGPDRGGVAFRQLAATARQLGDVGDRRSLMMRINAGFSSQAVSAEVSLVEIRHGEIVVIFSAPVAANGTFNARIAAMLKGFDDPDTHMAVVDDQGTVLAASAGFDVLGILPETCRSLIAELAKSGDGLIKRPIASAAGYLPAAIGKLSIDPPLNLLFCVETVLGRMDPPQETIAQTASLTAADADRGDDAVSLPGTNGSDRPFVPAETATQALSLAEAVENMPQTFSSAGDQAEAASAPEEIDQEPEDHAEANMAPTTVRDEEGVIQDGSPVEQAYLDSLIDHAGNAKDLETTIENDVVDTESQPHPDAPTEPHSEFLVDTAELAPKVGGAEDTPADLQQALDLAEPDGEREDEQPEDHIQAEMAEAALNEGESDEDVQDLTHLDNASEETVAALLSDGGEISAADVSKTADNAEPETEGDHEQTALAESIPSERAELLEEIGEAEEPVELPAAVESEPAVISSAQADDDEDVTSAEFQFRRDSRPVRFVWKLDAQGHFSEVSEEFARTVGPHAGNINGMSYRDLDGLFNLDPNKEISALLERRDTWSGRTIRWPVEGTDLVVPVDLAALPTYSRNREFDGFRGFGIIRVADVEVDPLAVGFTLGAPKEAPPSTETRADVQIATDEAMAADDVPLTIDHQFRNGRTEEFSPDEAAADAENVSSGAEKATDVHSGQEAPIEDEFQGETPALKLESNPLASFSEKVIQLEERRARGREGLTPSEQNALREIARQLEPFGKRPNETLLDQHAQPPVVEDLQPVVDAGGRDEVGAEPVADDVVTALGQTALPEPPAVGIVEESLSDDQALAGALVDGLPEADIEDGHADEEGHDDVGLTASAADQIPLPILIHAGDRLVFANSEFKRFSGYQSVEALEAVGGLDALISRREGVDAGVYVIRADGIHVPVSARLQSVHYEGATLLMLTLTQTEIPPKVEDTTAEDQQAARKLSALKVEADELRSILETATDGVVVLDIDGRIRSMNRSASALFNFEDQETRGKPFAMLFAHESQKAVQDYLNGLIGHGVASVLNDGREVIGREASGGFIPLFMTMGRMPGSSSYCAVIRDITQWKRSEEELKTAKRAAETANQHKSDFLARVSHEIRTPLNAIIGFSDMIASEHFGPAGHARYVEYANDIGRSGRHVLDIVNDLLDISKIEAGEMDLEFAAVGINDCISEAVTLVQPQANAQRVIIRTSLSQSVPAVVADLRSIKQIAINILANAIRFTPSGGQIVVSTAYEPTGSVTLRIRDTGVGMSKTDLEQAMKPFGQVSPGARHRGDGTGLGLPLTRAMTEANRAMFSIQSAPNEGTLVEITFPPQRVLAD